MASRAAWSGSSSTRCWPRSSRTRRPATEAALRLALALERSRIRGVTTNRDFLVATLRHPEFLAGRTTTAFIERTGVPLARAALRRKSCGPRPSAAALSAQAEARPAAPVLHSLPSGWRNSVMPPERAVYHRGPDELEVTYRAQRDGGFAVAVGEWQASVVVHRVDGGWVDLEEGGRRHRVHVARRGHQMWVQGPDGDVNLTAVPRFPEAEVEVVAGGLVAPMPGKVIAVEVAAGDAVAEGQLLMIVEAMKMEHRITAPHAGVVGEVRAHAGDQVASRGPAGRAGPAGRGLMTTGGPARTGPLRIANCSGFYGDRLAAAREMVDGGPIDVLTGDWLAELTMLILAKNMLRDPAAGYARTFVTQMEQVMGDCLDRGIKVVSNAGGLSPRRCAEAVAEVADKLGLNPVIAYVEGDDLMPRMEELRAAGVALSHMETGEAARGPPGDDGQRLSGGVGHRRGAGRGADIVITGRVTDAALVVGPAAWHHRWRRDDWDALAGAVVAGHVIECGAQATGGNYAFFTEVPGLEHPGFPIAEVAADGSSVITKHPGHGGQVSVGTVTAQLLYEIGGPAYAQPRRDRPLRQHPAVRRRSGPGADLRGPWGLAACRRTKVALNYQGGFRSTTTLYLTGLDIEEKADLVERALWASDAGRAGRRSSRWTCRCFAPTSRTRPPTRRPWRSCASPSRTPTSARWAARSRGGSRSWRWRRTRACSGAVSPPVRPRTACTGRRWCRPRWCARRW